MKELLKQVERRQIKNVQLGEERIALTPEFFQMAG